MSELAIGAAAGRAHQAPPVAGADLNLGALFGARQIHTDEHGVHTDAAGQTYEARTVNGELTFTTTAAPDRWG